MSNNTVQDSAKRNPPSGFMDYCAFLNCIFDYIKSRTKPYSYQKFAEDLGFGSTTVLHQVVKKYRPLSIKAATKIAATLQLPKPEKDFLIAMVNYNNSKNVAERENNLRKMVELKSDNTLSDEDRDILQYFSEWYNPIIHELVGMAGFQNDPKWIATKIMPNIKPKQAAESLNLLQRLGYVLYDSEENTYVKTQERVSSGHRVKGMGLLRYHQQMIGRGMEALSNVPGKRRNIATITLNCDEKTAAEYKSRVTMFLTELLDDAEKKSEENGGDQVYQINVQLFPFTES